MVTGSQYVGSSNDLAKRLFRYLSLAYLNAQHIRGSIISRAILAHGMSGFTLEVVVLGPSLPSLTGSVDHVNLEQYYLDTYEFQYNAKRIATPAAHTPRAGPVNVGVDNPSYGKFGANSPAWNLQHSVEARTNMSTQRGTLCMYVYNVNTLLPVGPVVTSGAALSALLNTYKPFGLRVYSIMLNSVHQTVVVGDYIVSAVPMTISQLALLLPQLTVVPVPVPSSRTNLMQQTIYGKHVETSALVEWKSKELCTKALTGRSFMNKSTMNRRLNKGIPFYGYLLQTKPFKV